MRPTFGVQGLGFRVEGLQFGVWVLLKALLLAWGLIRAQGLEFTVCALRFESGFRV